MKQSIAKRLKKLTVMDVMVTVILTLLAIVIIIPFWSAIVISFSTNSAYVHNPFSLWPKEFTLSNYKMILNQSAGLITAYKNTIYLVIVGTLLSMTTMVMAAYAFSREFPGKRFVFMAAIFTMYFSGGLIPSYLMIKNLGLLNSTGAVFLMHLCSVYNIIVLKSGFEGVPRELQEAAMIDGANDLVIFGRVMLPLQKPLIATFSLFKIVEYWNCWYWPMLVINDPNKATLQQFLRSIINNAAEMQDAVSSMDVETATFSTGVQMASVLVVILPIMLVYPFLQKYFVKGSLVGSVKM